MKTSPKGAPAPIPTTPDNAIDPFETVKELFGDYPGDVIEKIKSAADALIWLEEIFTTIKNEALNERNGYRIKHLAEAGAHLAFDMGNYAGCEYETYTDRLKAAGVIQAGGPSA